MEAVAVVSAVVALVLPLAGPPVAGLLIPIGGAEDAKHPRLVIYAAALFGPALAAAAALNALWLLSYSGQCGGWLGETQPCGFAQYAGESLYASAMTIAMPAMGGLALGLMALGFRAVRARRAAL